MQPIRSSTTSWCLALAIGLATWVVPGCAGNAKAADAGRVGISAAGTDADPAPGPVLRTLRGYASFYGPGFAGEKTASGEIFNPREMVAAHRTLPLGSRVRVTNLANGRTIVLRVIDRGPFAGRRTIIDVSEGAARRLDFIRQGLTPVKVEVLASGR